MLRHLRAPVRAVSLVAAASLGGALLVHAPAAVAGERNDLPVDEVADVLLDEGRDRLLVLPGAGSEEVLVTDLTGASTGTIALPDAVSAIADEERGWYWVALGESHAIASVDAETLEVLDVFDVVVDPEKWGTSCPDDLGLVEGRIAFTSYCEDHGSAEYVRVLDPGTGEVTGGGRVRGRGLVGPPASAPAGSELARSVWTYGWSSWVRVEIDSETGEPTTLVGSDANMSQMAISPDGTVLAGNRGVRLDPLTMERLEPYQLPLSHPDDDFEGLDVAFGPDGRTVFTAWSIFPVETVQTVPAGSLVAGRSYDLFDEPINRWRNADALAVGETDVYVVSRGRGGPRLDVLSPGEDATLTLGRPEKSYPYGATATIPVTLDARSEHRTLDTWVASYGGGYRTGAEVEVAEDGTGTVSVRLKSRSSLLVGYDAVDTSESDRDTVNLWVRPRLTLEFPKAKGTRRPTYAAGSNARIAVEVKGRPACVRLHVDQRIAGRWKRIHRSDCEPPRRKHVSTTLRWKPSLAGAKLRVRATSAKDRFWAAERTKKQQVRFR